MTTFKTTLLIVLSTLLFFGCDEELPPQNNPTELFTSKTSIEYKYNSESRPTQSAMDIYIVYKNFYDESLDDFASMKGIISIEWIASPEERGDIDTKRTDVLTLDNLFYASKYDFSSNKIIIDAGDSIILRYRWNLKTDDSSNIMFHAKFSADRDCYVAYQDGVGPRGVSTKQQFRISARFSIFQRGGTIITSPDQFSSCWIAPHYGELSPCNQPNPLNPCSVIIEP